jgi:hypothetical protein
MVASMSAVTEQLVGQIEAAATNGVCWGSRSALVATGSHFPELVADLEVLKSGCNVGLIEDEVNTL